MPERSRRRSRDPETDDERPRRTRRPSNGISTSQERRRRRGHRATDSTGELLPKSASTSTPTRSGDSSRDSGAPLSLAALAELDRINKKKEKKKGWNTYDEAYVAETRAREEALEEERKKEERRRRRAEKRRQQEEEAEVEAEKERLEEKRRRRDEKRARRESERVTEDEAYKKRMEVRMHKRRAKDEAIVSDAEVPATPKRKQKYQKLDDLGTPDSRQERSSKKSRLISGPYLEDGRTEKVYRHEKNSVDSMEIYQDHAARKAKMKKYICESFQHYVMIWLIV